MSDNEYVTPSWDEINRLIAELKVDLGVMRLRADGQIDAGIEQLEKHANEGDE